MIWLTTCYVSTRSACLWPARNPINSAALVSRVCPCHMIWFPGSGSCFRSDQAHGVASRCGASSRSANRAGSRAPGRRPAAGRVGNLATEQRHHHDAPGETALIAIARCSRSRRNSTIPISGPGRSPRPPPLKIETDASAASCAVLTLSVVSRNHCTGSSSLGGGCEPRAQPPGLHPRRRGRRQRDAAEPQLAPCQALLRGAGLFPAGFGTRRQSFDLDVDQAVGLIVANSFGCPFAITRSYLARTSSSTRGRRRCTVEKLEHVGFAVTTQSAARRGAFEPRRFSSCFESVFTGSKPSASTGRPVGPPASRACARRRRRVRRGAAGHRSRDGARSSGPCRPGSPGPCARACAHAALTVRREDVLWRDLRLRGRGGKRR